MNKILYINTLLKLILLSIEGRAYGDVNVSANYNLYLAGKVINLLAPDDDLVLLSWRCSSYYQLLLCKMTSEFAMVIVWLVLILIRPKCNRIITTEFPCFEIGSFSRVFKLLISLYILVTSSYLIVDIQIIGPCYKCFIFTKMF